MTPEISKQLILRYFFPILLGALILSAAALATGCGKKGWPEPRVGQDTFTFERIEASVSGPCFLAQVVVGGNLARLDSFQLEIEENGCPDCPFRPKRSVTLLRTGEGVSFNGNTALISYCGLTQGVNHRFKLVGINDIDLMPAVESRILP